MTKLVWNKLAVPGTFKGHPAGPFAMDGNTFEQIEKNFARDGIKVPFDYEHASEQSVANSDAKAKGDAVAAGWIHEVKAKADGLYGLVEWLPEARAKIKAGEFKYISPAIRFGATDGVTGEKIGAKLTSAALTLKPFLKSLPEVQASDAGATAFLCSEITGAELSALASDSGKSFMYSANEYLPALRNRLGMDQLASPKEMHARVSRIMDLCDMADGDPNAVVEGIPLINHVAPLRDYMRMPANTSLSDMLCAVAEMICAAMPDDDDEEDSEGADMADMVSADATQLETSPAPASVTNTREITMAENTITLADHEVKVTAAVEAATAPLSQTLKAEQAKVVTLTADLDAANLKIKQLTDAIEETAKKTREDRVTEAFDTYKTVRKLSDADRKAMTILLSNDAALFEELYPRQSAERKPLLHTATVATSRVAGVGPHAGAIPLRPGVATTMSASLPTIKELTEKYKTEFPNKSFDEIFDMAMKEQSRLMAA